MATPIRTKHPDSVGPIQAFPFNAGMDLCYDISIDAWWIHKENDGRLYPFSFLPELERMNFYKTCYCGGVRIIYKGGLVYTALAMNFTSSKPDSYIDAYNRAMSVIKH